MNSDNYGSNHQRCLLLYVSVCAIKEKQIKNYGFHFISFCYALTWTDYVKIFSVKKTFFFLSILVNKIRPKKHKYCKSLESKINVK